MSITEKINSIEKLYRLNGCTDEDIQVAETTLGFVLPPEYVEYVKTFGAISFEGTEWCGLGMPEDSDLNVIKVTMRERKLNSEFPANCFVIEDLGIEGQFVLMGTEGRIYSWGNGEKATIHDNLEQYLDACLERKNK